MQFKMGDVDLKCPACCTKSFATKSELIEHLASILDNIVCPICNNKWSSLGHLIEHLTLDNCRPDDELETITFDISNIESVSNVDVPTEEHEIGKLANFQPKSTLYISQL